MNAEEYKVKESGQYDSVREYVEKHKTDLNDDDINMYPHPRVGCHHCHGLGREGFDWFSGEPKICRCISSRMYKKGNTEFMSWKEFKTLMLSRVSSRKPKHLTPKSLRRSLGKKLGKYEKLEKTSNDN